MQTRLFHFFFIVLALTLLAPEEGSTETKSRTVASWSSSFSDKTQVWILGLPQPMQPEEKEFLKMLAKIHESSQVYGDATVKEMAAPFKNAGEGFRKYVLGVLDMMSPFSDQREKNFIYRFAQTVMPQQSLASYITQDVHIVFRSGAPNSVESKKLAEILSSQNDIPEDEKQELMKQYGISGLPHH